MTGTTPTTHFGGKVHRCDKCMAYYEPPFSMCECPMDCPPIETTPERRCSRCKAWKSMVDFWGTDHRCIPCSKAQKRERYVYRRGPPERARIVAYLRAVASGGEVPSKIAIIAIEQLADQIERGEHEH